jgi:hypothetical protein
LEVADGAFAVDEHFEGADARRVGERFEQVGLYL